MRPHYVRATNPRRIRPLSVHRVPAREIRLARPRLRRDIEKLRTKGTEAERQALERVCELPQARGNLIELGAHKPLDNYAAKLEEAFADNPRKWGEPLQRAFKQNRDDLARLVTTTMSDLVAARDKRQQRGFWAQPVMA